MGGDRIVTEILIQFWAGCVYLDLGRITCKHGQSGVLPKADIVDAALRWLNVGEVDARLLVPDLHNVAV